MKKPYRIALTAVLIVFTIVMGLIAVRRSLKGSNDFDTFYEAGKAVWKQQGIYYSGEYYQTSEGGSPFLYPPFAACFFSLWAIFPLPLSAFLWNLFSIALFLGACGLALRILGPQHSASGLWKSLGKIDRILSAVLIVALFLDNLVMAQVNILVLAATLCSLFLWKRNRPFQGGLMLAFAVLIKVTPALFLVYFLNRKTWRFLAGTAAGLILFTLVIPTLTFGWETNRIYHRQWLGRTAKPLGLMILKSLRPEPVHPFKLPMEIIEKDRMTTLLIDKNQSLSAALTRWLLKDRKQYGYEPQPIYAARRYESMPVILGGIPKSWLSLLILGLQLGILFLMIRTGRKAQVPENKMDFFENGVLAVYFLALTLLSPLSRSHQFIHWLFPLFFVFHSGGKGLIGAMRAGAFFYFLQALPYGKAAGVGSLANSILFAGFLIALHEIKWKNPKPAVLPVH